MIDGPLGLFQPGTSLVHRTPVVVKIVSLALFSVLIVVIRGWESAVIGLLLTFALVCVARLRVLPLLRALWPMIAVVAVLIGYQSWQRSFALGLEVGLDLLSLVVLATTLTATTPTDHMLDVLVKTLSPLRRFGADAQAVSLAISLMLMAIPTMQRLVREARAAALARGLSRNPARIFIPVVLRTVSHAQATADAIVARGLLE